MLQPWLGIGESQLAESDTPENCGVRAPDALWVQKFARQALASRSKRRLSSSSNSSCSLSTCLLSLKSFPIERQVYRHQTADLLPTVAPLLALPQEGRKLAKRIAKSQLCLVFGQSVKFCYLSPRVTINPRGEDLPGPIVHVLDDFLHLEKTFQIARRLQVPSPGKLLKLPRRSYRFDNFMSSPLPFQCSIKAMKKSSK